MPNWTKEQLDAINMDNSNIIVSAGAGSGKTAVLSERVIRKIKDGVHINELLILTFTNAAAKEMKDRIRKKIINEGLYEELDLIESAFITTFDSYSLTFLKKYHHLLNIDKDIKIADNDIINYKKSIILNEIFDDYYISNNELFKKMIYDFCVKDDEDIKKYILNISSKLDLKIDIDSYLDNYIENKYNNFDFIIEDLEKSLLDKIYCIKELLNDLSYYVDNNYYEKIKGVLDPLFNSTKYDEIRNNISISLPRLVTEYEEAKTIKESIKEEIDTIKDVCSYGDKETIVNNILMTKDYVIVLIDIIKELNKRIGEFKYKNNIYEFTDVAKLSIKLLQENENIRNEIRNSINEIMIDEYQDTNDIQETFISLISNNNVYMVGDIKQSIYRFRNANPYIFKNKYENYSKKSNGIKIDLNKNFRSREETLNNINKVFNLIMDSDIGGADYSDSHQMIFGNSSYNKEGKTNQNNDFEIYNYDYNKELGFTREETEIFLIANDINNKINNNYKVFDKDNLTIRNVRYDDFVILLDRSKDFTLYKKIFEYMNIPLTIFKDEKINDSELLLIIKNMFITISKINQKSLDNEFKHSFVSVLRSFLFEYNDEEIFDLFLENSFEKNDLFIKLKTINIDSMTIKELLNYVIDEFNIINSLPKIGNVKENIVLLEYLLNYVDLKEEVGYTIEEFATYLNEILEKKFEISFSSKNTGSNSVKIMTIHKSKGLEYSICYYAGLYNKFNISDVKDRFLYDEKYGIVTPYFKDGIGETIYKYLIKENITKEEISEKIRLLYVALTRAKEKMIIIADLNGEEYNSKKENGIIDNIIRLRYRSFLDIIISVKGYLKEYIVNKNNTIITKDYLKIKPINYSNYIEKNNTKIIVNDLIKVNDIISENTYSKKMNKLLTKEEMNNINNGLKLHYLFEVEDFDNPKSEIVKRFLEKYNYKKPLYSYKEYEFIFEDNNNYFHGIIDLMLEYSDYIDIIDYKLNNINDEAYKNQLNGYKKYIESKTNKKVNIYLYSIINNEIRKL